MYLLAVNHESANVWAGWGARRVCWGGGLGRGGLSHVDDSVPAAAVWPVAGTAPDGVAVGCRLGVGYSIFIFY